MPQSAIRLPSFVSSEITARLLSCDPGMIIRDFPMTLDWSPPARVKMEVASSMTSAAFKRAPFAMLSAPSLPTARRTTLAPERWMIPAPKKTRSAPRRLMKSAAPARTAPMNCPGRIPPPPPPAPGSVHGGGGQPMHAGCGHKPYGSSGGCLVVPAGEHWCGFRALAEAT